MSFVGFAIYVQCKLNRLEDLTGQKLGLLPGKVSSSVTVFKHLSVFNDYETETTLLTGHELYRLF